MPASALDFSLFRIGNGQLLIALEILYAHFTYREIFFLTHIFYRLLEYPQIGKKI